MAWVHNRLLPALIVLPSVQTRVSAHIFYLQRRSREGGKQWEETKPKTNIQYKLFKQLLLSGVHSLVSNWKSSEPSGDPKWKPTVARQSSEVWKEWRESLSEKVCVILLSQSGGGWDQAWRFLGKCWWDTRRSFCTAVVHGAPHAWRYLQRFSVETRYNRHISSNWELYEWQHCQVVY